MVVISPDAIQSVEQLKAVWRLCVEDRYTGEVHDFSSLSIRWADNQFPFWNTIANTEIGANRDQMEASLVQAARYMRGKQRPGFLWLFEDLLAEDARADLQAAADRAGLSLVLSGFGMAGDVLPIPEPKHPDLEFVRVSSDAELAAYGELNCRAYGFGPESRRDGFDGSKLWKERIHAYLALKDGEPVAAAGTVEADGCLFVILVATAAEHRRKGYGEATTRKALYEGARESGVKRATLHATMAGLPVYERIGLRKVASIGFYGLKA